MLQRETRCPNLCLSQTIHFILQDRVHHRVTGCCHPGNVTFWQIVTPGSKLWQSEQTAGQMEAISHEVHDWSWFIFLSMWPRFLQVQMQYGCPPWRTSCCLWHIWTLSSKAVTELPPNLMSLVMQDLASVFFFFFPSITATMHLRYGRSQRCLNFLSPGMPASPCLQKSDMEPDKWATLLFTDETGQVYKGGHPKHWSSVICRHQGI